MSIRKIGIFIFALCANSLIGFECLSQPLSEDFQIEPNFSDGFLPAEYLTIKNNKVTVTRGKIPSGKSIIAMEFTYKRTAVLKTDFVKKIGGKPVLKAGAKGFWAGSFFTSFIGAESFSSSYHMDMWCFFGKDEKDEDEYKCIGFGDNSTILTDGYVGPPFTNRYLPLSFELKSHYAPNRYPKPEIVEQEIEIFPNPKLDVVFWRRKDKVSIQYEVNGESVGVLSPNFKNGIISYDSAVGKFQITKTDDESLVNVEFAPWLN